MPRFSQVRSDMRHAYEANLRIKPLSSTWNVRNPQRGPAEKSEGNELTGRKSMIMAMGINMCITYLIWLIIWYCMIIYIYKIYNQQYGLKLKSIKLAKYSDDLLFQIHVQSVLSNKKCQKNQKMSRTSTCSIPRWVWRLLGRRLFAGRRGLRLRLRTCQRFSGPPWCSLVGQVPVRSGFVYGQPSYFFTSTTFSMNFYVVLHSLVILGISNNNFLETCWFYHRLREIPWFFLPKKVGLRPWPWEIIHGNLRSRAGLAFSIGSPVWNLRRSLKKSWRMEDGIFSPS